jgi:hypothetical protein
LHVAKMVRTDHRGPCDPFATLFVGKVLVT